MPHHHYVPQAVSTIYLAGLPVLEKCLGNLQLQVRDLNTTLNGLAVYEESSFIAYHLLPATLSFLLSFSFHPRIFGCLSLHSCFPQRPVLSCHISCSFSLFFPQRPVLSCPVISLVPFLYFFLNTLSRYLSSSSSLPFLPGIMLMSNNGSNSGRNSTRDRTGSSDPAGIDLLLAPFSRTSSIQTSEGSPRGLTPIS